MNKDSTEKPNRLFMEKSPYLLQHAHNPVDWYPWGEEAFARAAAEDKPIFLSIGYSTCHWCHVMERESFEDPEIASLLNNYFISIKVDREERPDIDQIYMSACQALTGQGGWPLTIVMGADKRPFFAATYLPKRSRPGLPGLMELLPRLYGLWASDRRRVVKAAGELTDFLQRQTLEDKKAVEKESAIMPSDKLLDRAFNQLAEIYDHDYGGFGQAPKFPSSHRLIFLLRYWKKTNRKEALNMALKTLTVMHRGGIFDQIGYGLHRYSVDRQWLVPHFEKMLYDQAMTALAAMEAYSASGEPEMASFARKICQYILNCLHSPTGGFWSAEDADSEGKEGAFYIWSKTELLNLLGEYEGGLVAEYYDVADKGNFDEGKSILHRPHDDKEFAAARDISSNKLNYILNKAGEILREARNRRVKPFLDDKIITAWNGLSIAALARGAVILDEPAYLAAAEEAVNFITGHMLGERAALWRRYRDGEAAIEAFLEDYAFLAWGLIELYRADGKQINLDLSYRLTGRVIEKFYLQDGNLLFGTTDAAGPDLPVVAEVYDGAHPSAVSVAVMNMLRLGHQLSDPELLQKGELIMQKQQIKLTENPTACTSMLTALEYALRRRTGDLSCTVDGDCGWE
ncbi:MAG TPA: thioredoxin domain-containing protein [Firmicutes bacterium]|nr:thioredoxin domain-containing protein [Bacillota bacterium]